MIRHSGSVREFWDRVRREVGIEADLLDAFGLGDTRRLTDELLALVLDGRKLATTTLAREMEAEGYPEPRVGAYSILLSGDGRPAAVIRTVALRRARFCDVDAEHAFWEGEGDRILEDYRREHAKYFKRVCGRLGFEFDEGMEVILERFELVYPARR